MPATTPSLRPYAYRPALAAFAALGSAWVFVLVALGAFTTTIGAGMAFPDWPLSNGSVNPHGWLTEIDKFAEHSHRLSASVMGLVTIALAVWLGRTEERRWLRWLAYFAVGLVIVQGAVGGLRVLMDRLHVAMVNTSVGRLFAMLHAVLAQLFTCTLIATAVSCTRGWIRGGWAASLGVRRAGIVCCALLFVQLAIAAVIRHSFAGLAIPTFPQSTPGGGWLPSAWNFPVTIHFAHRVMAVILAIALPWFAFRTWADRGTSLLMRGGASLLMGLLVLQILLGAQVIWTQRAVVMTTSHVLVGAVTLATTFWLCWLAHRDPIENGGAA